MVVLVLEQREKQRMPCNGKAVSDTKLWKRSPCISCGANVVFSTCYHVVSTFGYSFELM